MQQEARCHELFLVDDPTIPEESMASPKNNGVEWRTIIATAVFVGGILWTAHYEIGKLDDRIAAVDKHIGRVETAVRIVGAKQGGDTKTLIDEALIVAKNASAVGHTETAKTIVDYANRLLEEQKQSKSDVSQQFFDATLAHYQSLKNSPVLRHSAQAGALALVEYKSAITPVPSTQGTKAYLGEIRHIGQFTYIKDSYFVGNNVIATSPQGTTLDYMIAENVTFKDATIVYNGGPVALKNVRFINCRFVVPDSPQGDRLLTAAITQPITAQIG